MELRYGTYPYCTPAAKREVIAPAVVAQDSTPTAARAEADAAAVL